MRTISGQYEVASQPAAVAVDTSSKSVLNANRARQYLLLVNDSANIIYVGLGNTAVANQGIRLNANGGSYEMSVGQGNLFQGSINCIASASASNLLITEGT